MFLNKITIRGGMENEKKCLRYVVDGGFGR